jgi:hypothetical protein
MGRQSSCTIDAGGDQRARSFAQNTEGMPCCLSAASLSFPTRPASLTPGHWPNSHFPYVVKRLSLGEAESAVQRVLARCRANLCERKHARWQAGARCLQQFSYEVSVCHPGSTAPWLHDARQQSPASKRQSASPVPPKPSAIPKRRPTSAQPCTRGTLRGGPTFNVQLAQLVAVHPRQARLQRYRVAFPAKVL